MKKIIFCATLLFCNILLLHAQSQYLGVQIGFTQPITRLNQPILNQEKVLNPTIYNGFKAGVVYDATLVAGFGYSMAINYTFGANKTNWEQIGQHPYPRKETYNFYHQIEIPVDWQYKFEIAQNTWVILYTGPTLQCGLSFLQDTHIQNQPNDAITSTSADRYTMSDVSALKRINITWGIGAGLQYEQYFLRGGYDFGVINPYKESMFTTHDIYTRGRFDQWQIKLGMYIWSK